ncbi:BspA family leucine-rich repeat surface protein [Dermabacteraceae bacterium P7074]
MFPQKKTKAFALPVAAVATLSLFSGITTLPIPASAIPIATEAGDFSDPNARVSVGVDGDEVYLSVDRENKIVNITGNGTLDINRWTENVGYDGFTPRPLNPFEMGDYTFKFHEGVKFKSKANEPYPLFEYFRSKVELPSDFDASGLASMERMFEGAEWGRLGIDVSGWDTSNVVNMHNMFANPAGEKNVSAPEFSNWDTSKVTDMSGMFIGATFDSYPVSKWNTSSLTNAEYMFYQTTVDPQEVPDVSNWDVSKLENAERMFAEWEKGSPDVSRWNTSQLQNITAMFAESPEANPDTTKWDTSNIKYAAGAFSASGLTDAEFIDIDGLALTTPAPTRSGYEGIGLPFRNLHGNFKRLAVKGKDNNEIRSLLGATYCRPIEGSAVPADGQHLLRCWSVVEEGTFSLSIITDEAAYKADPEHMAGKKVLATFTGTEIPDKFLSLLNETDAFEVYRYSPNQVGVVEMKQDSNPAEGNWIGAFDNLTPDSKVTYVEGVDTSKPGNYTAKVTVTLSDGSSLTMEVPAVVTPKKADPADPVDPKDPADPKGPADPKDPADPAEPADPADPQGNEGSTETPNKNDGQRESLPRTGAESLALGGLALSLIVAGGVLLAARRFRKM